MLCRFHSKDVAEFVVYRSSAEVASYQAGRAHPREKGERFVRQMMRRHPDTAGEWFQFAAVLRARGS